jgi:Flp pilus assembly protein CpaB
MNLLAIIVIFLAIATAGAIAYVAWELSSDKPRVRNAKTVAPGEDRPPEN